MAVKRAKTSPSSDSKSPKPKPKAKVTAKTAARPTAKAAAKPAVKKAAKKKTVATVRAVQPVQRDIVKIVEGALDDMKAVNIKVLDVRKLTDVADTLVIASGNSDRHVRSIADRVVEYAKKAGMRPMGVEGERDGEWVLVDLQDVIVHIMLPRVREFYRLENLWDVSAARREAAQRA
jgi:ribosome silencing factor RsfS/YbeB/iojap